MSLLGIPEDVREECRRADINARSVLLEIARLKDPALMREAILRVTVGSTRDDLRTAKKETGHPKRARRFAFVYRPKGGPFKLNLSFQKSRVDRTELIDTLRHIIKQLEAGEIRLPRA
jgi:hypothetical protein